MGAGTIGTPPGTVTVATARSAASATDRAGPGFWGLMDTDPALTARLAEILEVNLADDVLAWELRPDGWRKVRTKAGLNSHERLQELARSRAFGGV